MTNVFLGEPPADIKAWIIEHATPAGHSETRFTLQDGTVETHNITGTLDQQWMIDNGYYDEDDESWTKTITQADIGNTVTSIGNFVFSGSSGLTSVTIPDSVTSIWDCAFSNCTGLTSVTIPDSVTSIWVNVFESCSGLTNVTIGNGVTSIGDCAFYNCSGLTSVTIPDSVTSIGEDAFFYCDGLTSVTITSNGGNAENVKQKMISAGVSSNVTWNMPN